MKKILVLCLILVIGLAIFFLRKSGGEHFGPEFKGVKLVPLEVAVTPSEDIQKEIIAVEGTITRQCPTSGCWFFITDKKGSQIRIELGHMGIKFPMRIGEMAKIEGRLMQGREGWQIIGENVRFGGQ